MQSPFIPVNPPAPCTLVHEKLKTCIKATSLGFIFLLSLLDSGCSTGADGATFPASLDASTQGAGNTQELGTNGSSANGSTTDKSGPAPEPCNDGELRDCSEDPKGKKLEFPNGIAQGNCRKGHQRCKNGSWGACQDAVGPKPSDRCDLAGDDSNCNAMPNEGCSCTIDQGPRVCGASRVGACELGMQACVDGAWQRCEGEVKASRELCDNAGIDEDCDGKVDIQDENCDCIHEEQELCSLPPAKGDCGLGKRICNFGKWGACKPRFAKALRETCGILQRDEFGPALGDEDCDGMVDNHPGAGPDPIKCKFYMVDEDMDGYGARGFSYSENQTDYSWGCFCEGKVPNKKSLVLSPNGNHNRDCGDCRKGGLLVHPGSVDFGYEASICLRGNGWKGGAFDYNCNGKQELEYRSVATCHIGGGGQCEYQPGHWGGPVPKCGEQGSLGSGCDQVTPPCELSPPASMGRQGCR